MMQLSGRGKVIVMRDAKPTGRAAWVFAGQLVAMLVIFRALDLLITEMAALPAAAYEDSVIVQHLPLRWWRVMHARLTWWHLGAVLALGVVAAVAAARWRAGVALRRAAQVLSPWDAVEDGRALRLLVVAITGITAWTLSSYPRNLYVDQLHLTDRLLLLGCWIGIAWRPIFVLPYAVLATAIAGQFGAPLGFITWTEMGVLLRLPALVAAYWMVRAASHERRSDLLIFGWCCLVAVTYWTSGLGKLRTDWFAHPHVALLMVGAHGSGWLASIDAATIARTTEWLDRLARPLMLLTLLLECGALVMLWRRWSLVGFLVLATLFHVGVFAMTGICFWKWVMADAFLLLYLLRGDRLARLSIFTPPRFAMSVAVIAAGPLWMRAENLTWFDTPLTYSLQVEGVDRRGATHALPAGFFRPFSDALALGTFAQVSAYPQLTRGMGVTTDPDVAAALVAARSPRDVFAIEERFGRMRTDSGAIRAFDTFVARIARRAQCAQRRDPLLLRLFGAPRHLWTTPLHESLPCDVSLATVRVFEQTRFYDGSAVRIIRRRVLREITIVE